jgi:hypothetical protein
MKYFWFLFALCLAGACCAQTPKMVGWHLFPIETEDGGVEPRFTGVIDTAWCDITIKATNHLVFSALVAEENQPRYQEGGTIQHKEISIKGVPGVLTILTNNAVNVEVGEGKWLSTDAPPRPLFQEYCVDAVRRLPGAVQALFGGTFGIGRPLTEIPQALILRVQEGAD